MDRRTFTQQAGIALAATAMGSALTRAAEPAGPVFNIGMLLFDGMTYLDLAAPHDALTKVRSARVHLLAKTGDPVKTDTGNRVLPDMAWSEAPALDMLFVGGGPGVTALMEDAPTLAYLAQSGARAQWVTSVCTGALLLGAAGLLRGYRAATHWTAMDILPLLGATPVRERVVIDRNRITGGGVTAGLDFGLVLVAKLAGEDVARLVQLGQEYDPKPPFVGGTPENTAPAIVQRFRDITAKSTAERAAAASRASARLGI